MFRPLLQKIRNGFHVSTSRGSFSNDFEFDEEINVPTPLPDDVGEEGCFTVFAVKGNETQRFTVELDNLTNPAFLRLRKNMDSSRRGLFLSLVILRNCKRSWKIGKLSMLMIKVWPTCGAAPTEGYSN